MSLARLLWLGVIRDLSALLSAQPRELLTLPARWSQPRCELVKRCVFTTPVRLRVGRLSAWSSKSKNQFAKLKLQDRF